MRQKQETAYASASPGARTISIFRGEVDGALYIAVWRKGEEGVGAGAGGVRSYGERGGGGEGGMIARIQDPFKWLIENLYHDVDDDGILHFFPAKNSTGEFGTNR